MKKVLTITFTILWLLDTMLTTIFVSVGGLELEANPLMRSLIASYGLLGFIGVKLAVLAFWLSVARHAHSLIHLAINLIMTVPVTLGILLVYSLLTTI